MDSPNNSGSIPSSSGGGGGGDEDYDPRPHSVSSYIDSIRPSMPFHHHSSAAMFDNLSSYFENIPRPTPLLNLDQNAGEINPRVHTSTSSFSTFFTPQQNHLITSTCSVPEKTTTAPPPPIPPQPRASSSSDHHARMGVRNPKKRSRASRRAPTTVLTTDTTNFRAMVQEFTGIPAPPFTSSPFPRSRFDLFGAPSNTRSNPLDSPFILKPFAQRPQQQISSLFNAITSTSTNNNNNTTTTINNNLSDFTLPKQPPSLNNMLNSFVQFEPKFGLDSAAPQPIEPPSQTHLKMGGLDEFGLAHGLPSLVNSDGANRDNLANWGGCSGGGGGGSDVGDNNGNLRGINGNFDSSSSKNTSGYKVNYLGSSSNFQEGNNKGNENVSSRSEGMLESWICSSD